MDVMLCRKLWGEQTSESRKISFLLAAGFVTTTPFFSLRGDNGFLFFLFFVFCSTFLITTRGREVPRNLSAYHEMRSRHCRVFRFLVMANVSETLACLQTSPFSSGAWVKLRLYSCLLIYRPGVEGNKPYIVDFCKGWTIDNEILSKKKCNIESAKSHELPG